MIKLFEVTFLEEVFIFLNGLEKKHREKIIYNIRNAQYIRDPELFKKLKDDIWEFRTNYQGLQYRLLAFWDKKDKQNTLVITSNAFIKKENKVPTSEILKAKQIRIKYFQS